MAGIVLVLGLGIVILAVITSIPSRFAPGLEGLLQAFPGKITGNIMGAAKFEGIFNGLPFLVQMDKANRTGAHYKSVTVQLAAPAPFNLDVHRETDWDATAKDFGFVKEPAAGDPELSKEFVVDGDKSAAVAAFLADGEVRGLIRSLLVPGGNYTGLLFNGYGIYVFNQKASEERDAQPELIRGMLTAMAGLAGKWGR